MYFNGTLHGNPVAAAATLAMLDELAKPGTYERLNGYAEMACAETELKETLGALDESCRVRARQ